MTPQDKDRKSTTAAYGRLRSVDANAAWVRLGCGRVWCALRKSFRRPKGSEVTPKERLGSEIRGRGYEGVNDEPSRNSTN
jgi:hypothetical protein